MAELHDDGRIWYPDTKAKRPQLKRYPKVQIISVPEILSGKRPALPPILLPYFQAQARVTDDTAEMLPLDSTPSGDPQAATTTPPGTMKDPG
jgi:hypothetical protein